MIKKNKNDFTNLSPEEKKELEKMLGLDNRPNGDKKDNDLALFSFLQDEYNRLNKLQDFVNSKINLMSKYPQSDAISFQLDQRNNLLKEELIHLIQDPNAELHRNIQLYFDQQFGLKKSSTLPKE